MEMTQKSNALGYVGAVLGSILAAVVFGYVAWQWGLYGALAAISGFVTYSGYKLLGGVITPTTKYVVVVLAMVGILAANYFLVWYLGYINSATVEQVLAIAELKELFLETFLFSMVFGIIGSVYTFKQIKQEEQY